MAKETQPVRVTDGHSSIWAIPAGAWEESTWPARSEASMNDVDADEHPQMMGPVRIDPKGGPSTGPGPGRHLVTAHPGQGSMTAKDQHQPASSRAIATFATTGLFLRSVNCSHRSCRRRLPA